MAGARRLLPIERQIKVAPALNAMASDPSEPIVEVATGRLRGARKKTPEGSVFYSFKGVPYGAAPVGDLRFKAPRPAAPWPGVRDAFRAGKMCHQPMLIPPPGPKSWSKQNVYSYLKSVPPLARTALGLLRSSEDCLFLNVFTPKLPSERGHPRLPVVVFIHGGGFKLGDGDALYGPEYLMDAGGIVVVTFNYRLGPFGFLAVGSEEAPGNAGLKDQVLLLQWVRDNVAAFGGDPDCVTLFGESAGAVSAHLHTVSPLSRGLFHRLIASSGLIGCDWAHEEHPARHARALAEALAVDAEDVKDPAALVRRLRAVPARALSRAHARMTGIFTPRLTLGMLFVPVVEPPGEGAFLSEDPVRVIAEGRQMKVPMLAGSNSREGLLVFMGIGDGVWGRKNRRRRRAFMAECARHCAEDFLPADLHRGLADDAALRAEVARQALRLYFGEDGMGRDDFDKFIDLFGDTMIVLPVLRMSRLHASSTAGLVYHYYFSHDGDLGMFKSLFKLHKYGGVAHADELGYVLRPVILSHVYREPAERDALCRSRMITLWTSFIRTGDPTPPLAAEALGVTWLPRSGARLRYLHVDGELRMRSGAGGPMSSRLDFWNDLYKTHLQTALF